MPRINITEHSETYSVQVRNNNYATVALPITAIWGPAYVADDEDNNPDWVHFTSGYRGTTDFINTFKGPNTYLGQREKSYDYALKLLAAGYDVLVKRVDGLGNNSYFGTVLQKGETSDEDIRIAINAKYPGQYGDRLGIVITKSGAWNNLDATTFKGTIRVYECIDGTPPTSAILKQTLLENKNVAFVDAAVSDNCPLITEAVFEYIQSPLIGTGVGTYYLTPVPLDKVIWNNVDLPVYGRLTGGSDYTSYAVGGGPINEAAILALINNHDAGRIPDATDDPQSVDYSTYFKYIKSLTTAYGTDQTALRLLYNQQILYSRFRDVMWELTDCICYDWDVLFCGIADDQYMPASYLNTITDKTQITYRVTKVMTDMVEVSAKSKCGCVFIGEPFNMPRGTQITSGEAVAVTGAIKFKNDLSKALSDLNPMYPTFAELVGPWCKTTLPVSGSNVWITPELAHLLLIINAQGIGGINKWWMIPAGMTSTGVAHTPEYKIKQTYLDIIQNHDEGVCLNPLMEVPGKGFTCFGNSTLWDKPLGTYNALQNLSTRLLCNRVKQRIWDVALQILFKYNNENAYSHFYAGLSPLLDEMRSVGALTGNEYNPLGYKIIMNPDIINLDRINANTVIGKVYLAVTGVIDTVDVDLFLLPPTGFMESYD